MPEEASETFEPELDLMTMPLVDLATSGFILFAAVIMRQKI